MADTELIVKVAASGAGRAARDVAGLESAIAQVAKEAKDARKVAQQMGKAFNLSDAEVEDLAQAIRQAGDQTDRLGKEVDQVSRKAGGLSQIFTGIAQGIGQEITQKGIQALQNALGSIVGTVGAASQEFQSFQSALVQFDAKSSASAEQIERVGEQAKELATVTSQSPAGVAALATALLTLGASADEVEENLEAITKLADVLGEDPVLTGQVVQTGVNIFGEFGETADSLSDKLNFLVNNSAAGAQQGLSEFFQLFSDVGGIVKSTGASFDDLAATFAVLRNGGAAASVAATGIKTALLALSSPTGEAAERLKGLGVSAFDSAGNFRGLGATLSDFSAQLSSLSQQEQLELAVKIFGREGAPAFLQSVKAADGSLGQLREQLSTQADGSLAESLEIVNQSLERQGQLLQGEISAALTEFGQAIAPVQGALISFARETLGAFTGAGVGLDSLSAAGERLQQALANNPQLAQQLGAAIADIASALAQGAVSGLSALADLIEQTPQKVSQLIAGFQSTVQAAFELADGLGAVIQVLGEIGGGLGSGAADAFTQLAPVIGAVAQVFADLLQTLTPLTNNTQLVSVAIQTLTIRMLALKAVALVGTLKAIAGGMGAMAVSAGTATQAMTLFKVSVIATTGPLIALAGAIAAVALAKHARDLKVANQSLDAYSNAVQVSTELGFKFANSLNQLNDQIAATGGKATDEQLRKLEEYKRLSIAQVEDLKRQIAEVQQFEPKNDNQRQAQQNLIQSLNTTIDALDNQISEAETTLSNTAASAGQEAGENLATGVAEGVEDATPKVVDAIAKLASKTQLALQKIETDSLNAQAAILESGGTQEEVTARETAALRQRVAENKKYLAEIKALQTEEGTEEAEKVAAQIGQIEQQLAQDRVAIARAVLAEQKKAEQERVEAAEAAAKKQAEAAEAAAKKQAEAAKKAAEAEAEIARERQQRAQERAREDFGLAQESRREYYQDEQRDRQRTFNRQQREEAEAHQTKLQTYQRTFQEREQAVAEAFQAAQQADQRAFNDSQRKAQAAFNDQQQAKRDRANREFDALSAEVDRRLALQQAKTAEERAKLKQQFAEEDARARERLKIEQQVLNQRGNVLAQADARGQLELSPLEQAKKEFEDQLKAEAEAFQQKQQEEAQAFADKQREQEKEFKDQQQARQREFEESQRLEQKRFRDEQEQKAFEFAENERDREKAFQNREREFEADFKARQRRLDKQNAREIAAILAKAKPVAVAGARRQGGPVARGQTYLVGEAGPELVTPRQAGYVHTAGQTQALLRQVHLPNSPAIAGGSAKGVEKRLDKLLKAVNRRSPIQGGGNSYTIYGEADPSGAAQRLALEQLRALSRGGY